MRLIRTRAAPQNFLNFRPQISVRFIFKLVYLLGLLVKKRVSHDGGAGRYLHMAATADAE
jgi:hypothetical protein